jgi:Tat protein translocase TatB subunit
VFNLPTGGEFLIILLVALVVLGPDKLPDAVRKAGRLYGEVRRMANGFQSELRDALDEPAGIFNELKEPLQGLRDTVNEARNTFLLSADEPVIPPGVVVDQGRGGADPDLELPGEDVEASDPGEEGLVEEGLVELGPVELPVATDEVADTSSTVEPETGS